jgi:LPXTG-site transpeptidase (sortase) family protein
MKFFIKTSSILMFVALVFLLLPGPIIKAQQMTEAQRQTLIADIERQIVEIRAQISQIINQQQQSPGIPVLIKIAKINVDAVINPVGLTPTGEMVSAYGPFDTAWFDLGPRPGNIGSAVINGHFGHWKIGVGSVFDNLDKLVKGDKISVVDENNSTIIFVVRESKIYDPTADASIVFNSNDGKAHLNLVTCEGTWLPDQKTFTNRLVIFADKE